jgi:F-type H+-transporting ATPase subunit delta
MIQGSLSRRYAKALFQLAVAEQREEAIGAEIERFLAALQNSELNGALNNPAFAVQSRKNIVIQVARSLQLAPLVSHFLSLLVERDRLNLYSAVVERYRRLLDEKKGQAAARVIAARPLEENEVKRLGEALEKISAKRVVIQQERDANLIGGLVVHLEGKIYDGSVLQQLESMKERVERGY